MPDSHAAIERVFREEYGRVIAALMSVFRDLDVAEEAVQEALVIALERWPGTGTPRNPGAWITTTAKRKAIDRRRRERTREEKYAQIGPAETEADDPYREVDDEAPIEDDRLRLIFTCCHPALGLEARVALTLRTLCGLTTGEIAGAFLMREAAMAQRLVRAKRKIRDAGIPYAVPEAGQLQERLDGVLSVIYLVFNEGYAASAGEQVVRVDMASEGIRLGRLLADLMPEEGEVRGLLALMLLSDARREARQDSSGEPVLLGEQDRSLWDAESIRKGMEELSKGESLGARGPYLVQAAIARAHARASSAGDTDWHEIVGLYEELALMAPSPVVLLNLAAAVAMAEGPQVGLALMDRDEVAGQLDGYRWLHSARGELLRRLDRREEAAEAYRRAIALSENAAELAYLGRRLEEVKSRQATPRASP